MILFGYKGKCFSMLLFDDGTLVYGRPDQNTVLCLCEKTLGEIRSLLHDNRKMLHQCGEKINQLNRRSLFIVSKCYCEDR